MTTNPTRDEARAILLNTRKLRRIPIVLNEVDLELQQPTIAQISTLQELDSHNRLARTIINYTYLPGTDMQPFEEADLEAIKNMPYTPEIMRIQEIVTNFLMGDVKAAEKN